MAKSITVLFGFEFGAGRLKALCLVATLALSTISLVVEAGLVRGGGRSGNLIISSTQYAGTVPFLIADPQDPDAIVGADLLSAASYGYGPIGLQANVEHDWGRDCSQYTECIFELGSNEVLNLNGKLVGLPSELATGSYNAVADLRITWELRAFNPPDPGQATQIGAPDPSDLLGPDFIWSSLFSATNSGSYGPGIGDSAVMLGESLGYLPGADEFSGCFSRFPSNGAPAVPQVLSVGEGYAYNDCRDVSLDLNLDPDQPTGADLEALLVDDEYLGILITTELLAPVGFQFASFYEAGGDLGNAAILANANIPTPNELRGLDSLVYAGCVGTADCREYLTTSQFMRINVIDDDTNASVPTPTSLMLLLSGLGLLLRPARLRRRGTGKKPGDISRSIE